MRIIKRVFVCIFLIGSVAIVCAGKEWRGIVPLKSTRADVEHLLGAKPVERHTFPTVWEKYDLPNEIVTVEYSRYPCHEKWPWDEWNVRSGIVTSILVKPKGEILLESLHLELQDYRRTRVSPETDNEIYYTNEKDGFRVEVSVLGPVTILGYTYLPASSDNDLRCPWVAAKAAENEKVCCAKPVGGYSSESYAREKQKLDEFADLIKAFKGEGYVWVVGYGGRRSHDGEAMELAERAKKYLVSERGLSPGRIIVIDGGYREIWYVDLEYSRSNTTRAFIMPDVHPSEVQFQKKRNMDTGSRHPLQPSKKQRSRWNQ